MKMLEWLYMWLQTLDIIITEPDVQCALIFPSSSLMLVYLMRIKS